MYACSVVRACASTLDSASTFCHQAVHGQRLGRVVLVLRKRVESNNDSNNDLLVTPFSSTLYNVSGYFEPMHTAAPPFLSVLEAFSSTPEKLTL